MSNTAPSKPRRILYVRVLFRTALFGGVVFASAMSTTVLAQTSPITGSGLNTHVSDAITLPTGQTQYNITGGSRPLGSNGQPGGSLFHSFGNFNVPTSNIANFLNETALPTANILGRVTGGNPSAIFGTIQTEGFGNANLFLINPAGIIFGPNATLNVGGSVTFSTANYLRLAELDGSNAGIFHADMLATSLLTTAPVVAFGFLGPNPNAISVQGTSLSVQPVQSISLIGGNQGFAYGDPDTGVVATVPDGVTIAAGSLSAPSGQILIASVASSGEILHQTLDIGPNINNATFANLGSVAISQGAFVDASGSPGGTVRIRGGEFVLDSSFVSSNTSGDTPGASTAIQIRVQNNVQLANGSALISFSDGAGQAGDIAVNASTLHVLDGSVIFAGSAGSAPAGAIRIATSNSVSLAGNDPSGSGLGSSITSDSSDYCGCPEPSGRIEIATGTLTLEDQATIQTRAFGDRRAGNIVLNVDDLNVRNGSGIQTLGSAFAPSGSILITAGGTITLSGQFDSDTPSRIMNINDGLAGTGAINVETGSLVLEGGARIRNEALASPAPGQDPKITIIANDNVNLSGGSNIRVLNVASDVGGIDISGRSDTLAITLTDQSVIRTETFGDGNAGPINIAANHLSILSGSTVESSTFFNSGLGGNISINLTGKLTLKGQGIGESGEVISSNISSRTTGSGNGGPITIGANSVEISEGALINANTALGTGSAGSVTIQGTASPAQSVLIDGAGSGIFTDTQGTGKGGDIVVNGNSVTLQNGGALSAKTSGTETTATGGTITVTAGQMMMSNQALVTAETHGIAPAGTVEINTGSLALSSGSQIRSSSGSAVPPVALALAAPLTGGSVTVQGQAGAGSLASSVSIDGAGSAISTATEGTQPGGSLNLAAQSVSISNGALVTAGTTGTGTGGAITINTGSTFAASAGTVSSTATQAQGGDITITAGNSVTLSNNSLITATSTGPGNAGNILINAGQNYTSTNSKVTTQATAPGTDASGGNITVLATDTVSLTDSQLNASVQGSTTTVGGNIVIDPQFVILQNSQILAQATQGQGGNITITTNVFLPDSVSIVDASSQLGVNGTVNIQSPRNQTGGLMVPLPKNSLEATTWINSRCRALAGGEASSFILAGHDSLPTEPAGWLSSPVTGLTGEPVLSAQFAPFPEQRFAFTQEDTVSLRRLTPPGFLLQAFAADPTDCAS